MAAVTTAFFPASASSALFVYAFTSITFGVISDYIVKWALRVACNGQDIQTKTTLVQIQHFKVKKSKFYDYMFIGKGRYWDLSMSKL